MGSFIIPALILVALLIVAFLVWELYFTRSGRQAMVEQNKIEGNDEPPTTL